MKATLVIYLAPNFKVARADSISLVQMLSIGDEIFYQCSIFPIKDEGHLSYNCPKNMLGDREPPPKKEKKKRKYEDEDDRYAS